MAIKVGINGFGRIGRSVLRTWLGDAEIDLVAVNDLTDTKTLAHLLKYDSVMGNLEHSITAGDGVINVEGDSFRVFSEKDPAQIPWDEVGADIVIESTGRFTNADDAKKHLGGSVKKVIISAPAKGEDVTIVLGVNEDMYNADEHHIISNASCTTNCLAPVAKVIHETFGIKNALMNTIHSYTNDQQLLDLPHKDLRRARAAALSMIPTSTGAAKAVALVIPDLKGKFDGISVRVPTPNVSLVDVVMNVEKETSTEEVNNILKAAANGPLKGILAFSEEPLVSIDFKGNSNSSIVDADNTKVIGGTCIKILSWYDNEWGYSCRVRDLVKFVAAKGMWSFDQ
ncbi:MAG TPA: type I glyceraldehyde-3-phosphate dehydrogenase [Pyrinomonadaceae bacterium]|nr:type I glyceraldehyde-3-phosphate dehydrogenase [Pyrinomonadaceae bacterium]